MALSHAERQKKENDQIRWLAFHIEALARTKRLPDFSKFMGTAKEAQTDEEMWAAWMSWVSTHNAKIKLAESLGEIEGD